MRFRLSAAAFAAACFAGAAAAQDQACADLPFASDEALDCYIEASCEDAEGPAAVARCISVVVTWREGELARMRAGLPIFGGGPADDAQEAETPSEAEAEAERADVAEPEDAPGNER